MITILFLAFIVRVWGISYGLPYSYVLDETFLVNHSLAFGTGDLNPHFFEWPGSLLMYSLFVLYGLYFLAGFVGGIFTSAEDFAVSFISDPTAIYLIGRFFTVLLSTATVYITYRAGTKLYDRPTGLIAALFLGAAPLVSGIAHFTLTDSPVVFISALSFIPFYGIVKGGRPRHYIVSGLLIGLGASIKYNAAALVVPLVVSHVLNGIGSGQKPFRIIFDRRIVFAFASVLAGFVAGCPFCVLDYSTCYADIVHQFSRVHSLGNINAEHSSPAVFYLKTALFEGAGIGVSLICLAGVAYAIYRRTEADILLLSFVGVYFWYISRWKVAIDKYLLPVIPIIMILGASLLTGIYNKYTAPVRNRRVFFVIGIIIVIAVPLKSALLTDYTLTQKDTRSLAKEWIEKNIPAGTRIAIDSGNFDIAKLSPPLRDIPENLKATYLLGGADSENKHIKTGKKILTQYYQLRLKSPAGKSYSLIRIVISSEGSIDRNVNLRKFMQDGVKYVVISSYAYSGYLSIAYRQNHPEAARYYSQFYQTLSEQCVLKKEFPEEPNRRQGPTIKIYEVPSPGPKRLKGQSSVPEGSKHDV